MLGVRVRAATAAYLCLLCTAIFSLSGCSSSKDNSVAAVTLTSVQVTPTNPSIAKGTGQQFVATATFSDNTHQDISASATWASSDTSVATISNLGLAQSVAVGAATITATYQSQHGSTTLTVTPAVITGMAVTPTNPSIAKGSTQQFAAIATFSDNTHQDVSASATWTSSAPSIATISSVGKAQSLATGTTTIAASYLSKQGSTALTVTPAVITGIEVTPTNPSIAKGTGQQFVATATFTDNTHQDVSASATWASSSTSTATISNVGLAQSLATGTTTITASYLSQQGTTTLTVTPAALTSIAVTPTAPSVANGLTKQFTATGTYTDNTHQDLTQTVTWDSSDTSTATVSNAAGSNGLAQSVAVGAVTIKASSGTVQDSTTLTVTSAVLASISVTPDRSSAAKGTTQQFTATGTYTDNTHQDLTSTTTWDSSNTNVADISNASGTQGLAAAKALGTTTVKATSGTVSGSTTLTVTGALLNYIQVTPANPKLAPNFERQFTATGIYSDSSTQDITTQVNWVSTNSGTATIRNDAGFNGLAKGVAQGTTTITAQQGTVQGHTTLTVSSATLNTITVSPASKTVPNGRTLQYSAVGRFSDSTTQDVTTQVTWSSSDIAIATISNAAGSSGLAKVVASTGAVTITATSTASTGAKTGTAALTASNADIVSIRVSPDTATIAKGLKQQFIANGTFSDGTGSDVTATVTWSSSNTAIATVSSVTPNQGEALGAGVGTATISAKQNDSNGNPVSGSSPLTVTAATLQTIVLTPADKSVPLGTPVQYTATGTYSDNSTNDITKQVTWTSNNEAVATISNAAGSQGLASTVGTGVVSRISAVSGGIAGVTKLTVTPATLKTIKITPVNPTIGSGAPLQFTATGTYTDGTTADVTTQVTWSSEHADIADISNSPDSNGSADGLKQGTTTITAKDSGTNVSDSTLLTVGPAALRSITISPPDDPNVDGKIPKGYKEQFTVTGHYADGTTQDLTASATWNSFSPALLTISNAAGSKGMATGVAVGSATITAQVNSNSFSANKVVAVTNATLTSIAVSPANQSLAGPNKTQQYAAVGTFSDGQMLDLTTQVNWTSSNNGAAQINNTGLATSQQVLVTTAVTISATAAGVTGTATLTVTAF